MTEEDIQNTSPDAPELQRLRLLADVQHTESDHIGSRFSLAQVVDQCISDLPDLEHHIYPWPGAHWGNLQKRFDLEHRIRTTVGGIINGYFTHPDLNDDLQDQEDKTIGWQKPLHNAVEKQRD